MCLGCTAPEPRAHRPEAHTEAGPSAAGLGQPSQQQRPGPSPWGLLGAARARACPALAIALMINNIYCGSSPQINSSLSSQSSSSDETEGSLSSPSLSGHASSSTAHRTASALNDMAASIIPSRVDVLCISKLKANVSSSSGPRWPYELGSEIRGVGAVAGVDPVPGHRGYSKGAPVALCLRTQYPGQPARDRLAGAVVVVACSQGEARRGGCC